MNVSPDKGSYKGSYGAEGESQLMGQCSDCISAPGFGAQRTDACNSPASKETNESFRAVGRRARPAPPNPVPNSSVSIHISSPLPVLEHCISLCDKRQILEPWRCSRLQVKNLPYAADVFLFPAESEHAPTTTSPASCIIGDTLRCRRDLIPENLPPRLLVPRNRGQPTCKVARMHLKSTIHLLPAFVVRLGQATPALS